MNSHQPFIKNLNIPGLPPGIASLSTSPVHSARTAVSFDNRSVIHAAPQSTKGLLITQDNQGRIILSDACATAGKKACSHLQTSHERSSYVNPEEQFDQITFMGSNSGSKSTATKITSPKENCQNSSADAEPERELQDLQKKALRMKRRNERFHERYWNDPAFAERHKARAMKFYRNNPAYAQRQRERGRECCLNDPVKKRAKRIYDITYKRIKRQTSSKEAARKQALTAKKQYLQSLTAQISGNFPLTSDLTETPNPRKINDTDSL